MRDNRENNSLQEKIREAAIKSLKLKSEDAPDAARPFLDAKMINAMVDVAAQAKFDDSPLVMKQKLRKLIKSRIRQES